MVAINLIMKNLVITCIICCINFLVSGQEFSCSYSYKHLTGLLDNEEMVMDIVIAGNQITGANTLTNSLVEDGRLKGMIRTQRLEGTIDEHGVATIMAYSENIESGEYSGMIGTTFSGTYREERGGMSRTFKLNENYGQACVELKAYCLDRDSVLLDTTDSPKAHINLSFLLPDDNADNVTLRKAIMKTFFGQEIPDTVPDEMLLSSFADTYFSKYINANIDLYDGGHFFNWEMIATSFVNINTNGLIVYRADNYGYTGGAHGIGISRFLVFDTQAMRKLKLDDIFDAGYENVLSIMLESKYRNDYYLGPEQSLTEAGLFENSIPPSNNFYLTTNSIGFYYNPYDLAPYAMGSISIDLTYDELRPLMKIDSPVMRIVR